MTLTQYLEILYNDSPNPCYFIEIGTKEVVFVNQIYKKKFQMFDDYVGKICVDILCNDTGKCALCQNLDILTDEFLEHRIFSKTINRYLRSNSTIMEIKGKKLLMTKFFLTTNDEHIVQVNKIFSEAVSNCLEFQELYDENDSIQSLLELLGEFYDCQYSYVYEFNKSNNSLDRVSYWSNNKSTTPLLAQLEASVDISSFENWLNDDDELTNYEANEVNTLHLTDKIEIFNKYNIKNITLNKIYSKDGSLKGVIGLTNREKSLLDVRLFKAVSYFVTEHFKGETILSTIENINSTDMLTGFYTRAKYLDKIREINDAPPDKLGILFVNLNGLRKTNEYFGYEVGDTQILNTAKILKENFSDNFFRISGDEFVCFIPDMDKDAFEKKVDKLHSKLKDDSNEASFAIGHAWESKKYSVVNLIKIADTIATVNKQSFYAQTFKENDSISNILLQDLLSAIADNEFMVYLQPQIKLTTNEIIGAEALIRRFNKAENRMVFPDNFIPLYEKSSIIRHVDLFVVEKVCELLSQWQKLGKSLLISVNLSRVTLMEHGIVKTITKVLDKYNIPHNSIVIEITERIGIVENDVASTLVSEFKANGFKLSLDDFGCAYSNIVTLAQIAVDEVKVDKSLVDNILINKKNQIIVESVIDMCNKIGDTTTLAEGIETQEQADILSQLNCGYGQGYLYSRPIPTDEFFDKYINI